MTITRFDPTPDMPYGVCENCPDTVLATEADARAHMTATAPVFPETGYSHSIRIQNAPRERRIESDIAGKVFDAIEEVLDEVDALIHRGEITAEEADKALSHHDEFHEAWTERLEEAREVHGLDIREASHA